jgi:plasmid maintenance system antidote protein VapI
MEPTNRYRATGLQSFITEQGRQLDWVAARGGVHESLISHLLKGRRTVRGDVAMRIAAAMGVPFGLLFELSSGSMMLATEQEAVAS